MNYYLDTEFIEDFTSRTLNIPSFRWKEKKHYVDLISIGIVSEDGREYYAVSKDFDLKHVWNKYDLLNPLEMGDEPEKVYWLRENVLRPIHMDLYKKLSGDMKLHYFHKLFQFTYKNLQTLILIFGKTRKEIAGDIQRFIIGDIIEHKDKAYELETSTIPIKYPPTFYGYYCDYDWVVFCSLFGRMLDLPKGYPMYCRDLKQMLDETGTEEWKLKPKNLNEHHVLADAKWNKSLHLNIKEWYHLQQFPTSTDRPNLVP